MKKSQLIAIAYAYAAKKRREDWAVLESLGLCSVFDKQKAYKTVSWFLKARENGSKKYEKTIYELWTELRLESDYENRISDNSESSAVKDSHRSRAAHCTATAYACEREIDRILRNAVSRFYEEKTDGN